MDTIFIGREEICRRLRRDVFRVEDGSFGRCYSLVGPNGIGKTMLIRHMAEEFNACPIPDTYYFSTVLEDGCTFWSFWSEVILQFADQIGKEQLAGVPEYDKRLVEKILSTYRFFDENLGNIDNDKESMSRAVTLLNRLFLYYKQLGIRIIITIDEFDRARTIFGDGQFFQRLFGLTGKGASNLNLSIITISRRSVCTIAHHMQEGSNFQDAYPPLTLKGFSNTEMEQYFATYERLGAEPLTEKEKQEIVCLCGRNPGLLMGMRHEIELLENGEVEISQIYTEHGAFVRTAYERMCTLMKSEYVNQEKTMSSMDIFIQQFIGPIYMEKISERLEKLYQYGFITKCGQNEENVYELSGLREYRDRGNLIYEPMSPYFVDYVKDFVVPDELNSLAGLLERTERDIRQVLQETISAEYPDTWEEVIDQDVPKKDDYLDKLREVAVQNDAAARNLSVSKLNVLAFMDYYKIIRNHWDIVKRYFSLYDTLYELKADLETLNTSRNTSAHLNLEILNDRGRRGLRGICTFLLENIETGRNGEPVPDKDGQKPGEDEVIGKTVELTNLELTSTGVLRGVIAESTMWATLSKKHLKEKGIYAREHVGRSVKVRIIRWDNNAQKYNAEWMEE